MLHGTLGDKKATVGALYIHVMFTTCGQARLIRLLVIHHVRTIHWDLLALMLYQPVVSLCKDF